MLTETHVTEPLGLEAFQVKGYRLVNCFSDSRHTGGVMMYVHVSLRFRLLMSEQNGRNWFLAIEITGTKLPGRYGVLYHSPNESDSRFLKILEDSWLEFMDLSKLNILVGDFNMDWFDHTDTRNLKLITESCGLKQKVSEHTRITPSSQTAIDLVFSNCDINVRTVSDLKISDHETLCVFIPCKSNEAVNSVVSVRSWKRYSRPALLRLLRQNEHALNGGSNLDEKADTLIAGLKRCVNELVDVHTITTKYGNRWYTAQLSRMRHERDQAYGRYLRRRGSSRLWVAYQRCRNGYADAIRRQKKEHVQQSIEASRGNSKKLWRVLKQLIKPETPATQCITFDGVEESDEKRIAEKFNSYFLNSISDISSEIQDAEEPEELKEQYTDWRLYGFTPITLEKLRSLIWSLEAKAGSDDISAKVLQDAFEVIGRPLMDVINESLETGKLPRSWKDSLVIPIEKVKATIRAEDHRPINMLPQYEKVLELAVKEQVLSYVSRHKLLVPEQSGYRKDHSCETALNLILAKWNECLEKKGAIIAVFLDLKRAFETISRRKLLATLVKYGFAGTVLEWFSEYLKGRSQRTKYGSGVSSEARTKFGVPQGSVLGPLLFILYINDMKRILKYCDINLFADDTVIFISADNAIAATELLNCDLECLSKWLMFKKLKLNVSKTKAMVISNRRANYDSVRVKMDGVLLERVQEIKYLGVLIDDKLSFKNHIDYTIGKIAKKYGVLCRLREELTQWSKIFLYKALISPHFDFCPSIIYLANEQQMSRLQKLQNKVMRLILRVNRRTPVRDMLSALHWLSVRQRVTFLTLMLIHKIVKGYAPDYLSGRIQRGRDIHSYSTRRANVARSAPLLMASTQNSLFCKGIRMYNTLPENVRSASNLNTFKRQCLTFVKANVAL